MGGLELSWSVQRRHGPAQRLSDIVAHRRTCTLGLRIILVSRAVAVGRAIRQHGRAASIAMVCALGGRIMRRRPLPRRRGSPASGPRLGRVGHGCVRERMASVAAGAVNHPNWTIIRDTGFDMADLVAQADDGHGRWRRPLTRGATVVLGRQHCQWSVPWDPQISRRHAELVWDGALLKVTRLPNARNPIYFRGHVSDTLELEPGQHFVIGRTTFTLNQSQVDATVQLPDPTREQWFSRQRLADVRFRDAERRLAVVTELPALIEDAATEQELFIRVLNVVFGGIGQAASAAVVAVELDAPHWAETDGDSERDRGLSTGLGPSNASDSSGTRGLGGSGTAARPTPTRPTPAPSRLAATTGRPAATVKVLHWDRRLDPSGNFQPSQRLILSAVKKQQTALHVWEQDGAQRDELTMMDSAHDWAFVTPLQPVGNRTLVLYVSGTLAPSVSADSADSVASSLQEDIKYAELIANILGSLLSLRHLQQRQASLRTFFSPVVLDALQHSDPIELFRPRECEVSILFCDLRGFSAASEKMAHDLLQLLQRVSEALGVTTQHILKQRGVVGDFHGDATMGFWGWPLAQPDRVLRACQAAIDIHQQFRDMSSNPENPLHGFQLGLGIASGTAVAGQIGTQDQVKVTAFGPVVNLAARLETMNRQLGTSILIEQRTAEILSQETAGQTQGRSFRIRSLGRVLPAGLQQPIGVSEVLPPYPASPLSDTDLQHFAQALTEFQAGRWEAAYNCLHHVPASDRAKDRLTMLITQHNRQAPPDWDGIIRLHQK